MSLILPKGIVVNSPLAAPSIERQAAKPLDEADITKFWKVYTTTQRRLLDPTAERLENYWWRIWGSNKKTLNGATVARLFAQISDGRSFVPLRGPPNRHDGTTPLETSIPHHGPGASSTTAIHQPAQNGPSTTSSSTASRTQAPMPHPILKKSKSPSTTGPRPTARFISPHESEHETEHEADQNSPVSPNSHVTVQPPSPDPLDLKADKKAAAASSRKKGGISASKKKRPVIVRRQSSQSSPENTAQSPGAAHSSTGLQSSSERTPPNFSDQSRANSRSKFQENFSLSPEESTNNTQSSKRRSLRANDAKRSSPKKPVIKKGRAGPLNDLGGEAAAAGEPGPSTLRRIENIPVPVEDVDLEDVEMQSILLAEANARVDLPSQEATKPVPQPPAETVVVHKSLRSNSIPEDVGTERMQAIRPVKHDFKGPPSLAPTLTEATGQINLGEVGANPLGQASRPHTAEDKGKGRDPEELKRVDMFAKRPVQPVQAAAATTVADSSGPLSRSKSQLTLLLEKDRQRTSGKKHGSEKGNRKKS